MATKVKGITIELTADTSGLETALKNANRELSATQRQLSSVNKSLKLDPGNVDLLAQKQKMLGKAIDETAAKLKALKAAQDNIKQNGGGDSAQYDALTREISDTTVKLGQLRTEQQQTGQALASAQAQSSAFAQGLQTVGNAAQTVAQKTAMLSAAAAAALGAMAGLASSAASTADDWLTMAQQTGLSTDAIQRFNYASDQIDVPLDTIVSSVNKMKSHLDGSADAFRAIGVEVRNQNGSFRDIEDIFNDTVRALGNIENETQRDTAAMKIFGRSANELAGLIDDGGAAMRQLGNEADSLGLIVSDEDLEKLGEYDNKLKQIKAQMSAAMMQAAVPVMEALLPIVEAVASAFQVLASVLASLPSPVVAILAVFLVLVAVLSPIAMGISLVTNAFGGLITTLPAIGAALGQLITAATAAIAGNPYVGVILAIIAVLALLGVAIYAIVTHWDEFKAAGQTAIDTVKGAVGGIKDRVVSMAEGVGSALNQIPDVIKSIASKFATLSEAAMNVASKVVAAFNTLREKAFNVGAEVMGAFASGIKSAIDQVTQAAQRLIQTLSNIWQSVTMDASRAGQQTGSAFANSYNQSSNQLQKPVTTSLSYSSGPVLSSLLSASSMSANTASPTSTPVNVSVELVGSAKNIFDTVRVQNNNLVTATGYHALG